jgi:Holliday junction resolvase
MKRINSRAKGKNGELELANRLKQYGFAARRGQQFHGGSGSPDVVCEGLSPFHLEVKRVEAGNLYNWLEQAIKDAGSKVPLVMHRRSNRPWVVIMRLDDFLTQLLVKDL